MYFCDSKKKADFALADFIIKEDRKQFIDYTVPYLESSLAIVIHREHAQNMKTFEDLANYQAQSNKSVQISVGFLRSGVINSTLSETKDSIGQAFYQMGMVDNGTSLTRSNYEGGKKASNPATRLAYITTTLTAESLINSYSHNCNLTMLADNRNLVRYEYAIALQKDSPWKEPIDRAITELKQDGTLQKLKDKYWVKRCP